MFRDHSHVGGLHEKSGSWMHAYSGDNGNLPVARGFQLRWLRAMGECLFLSLAFNYSRRVCSQLISFLGLYDLQ